MKWRISVFAILLALTIFTNRAFQVVVDPYVDNQIAASQLDDSEFNVARLRAFQSFSNLVPLVTWGFTFTVGVGLVLTGLRRSYVERYTL